MTPELAKLKQREDARMRSKQAPRRASSQAVSSDQSEVTEEAPAVYRVPQINVPEDLQGAAKLIQTELAKIEQSQSILLSLWEKVKDQANSQTDISFSKPITGPQVSTDYLQVGNYFNPTVNDGRVFRVSSYQDGNGHYISELISMVTDAAGNENASCWIDFQPSADGATQAGNISLNANQVLHNGGALDNGASYGVGGAVMIGNDGEFIPIAQIMQDMINNHGSGFYRYSSVATDVGNWSGDSCGFFAHGGDTCAFMHVNYTNGAVVIATGNDASINAGGVTTNELYGTANPPTAMEISGLERMLDIREAVLRNEIYAELLALNPGIVIPQTD